MSKPERPAIKLVPAGLTRPSADDAVSMWKNYAHDLEEINVRLSSLLEESIAFGHSLAAENSKLHDQMEARKPKGGKTRLPDETVRRIHAAIRSGGGVRAIAKTYGVSAMTVSRCKKALETKTAE